MDESDMRALLERVAEDQLPPVQVSIDQARGDGRRLLHRRRVYRSSSAPIAAAVAVALIAGLPVLVRGGNDQRHPQAGASTPVTVPSRFSMLRPYALFGWLPAGVGPARGFQSQQFETLDTALPGNPDDLRLEVNLRGKCELFTSTVSGQRMTSCGPGPGGGPTPVIRAPAVNGRPAYWAGNGLVWEYGPDAWASLNAAGGPKYFTQAQLLRVADGVRFGLSYPVRTPYQYYGIPVGWSSSPPATNQFLSFNGRPVSYGGSIGANNAGAYASIQALPAGPQNTCEIGSRVPDNNLRHVTVDGAPGVVWTVDGPQYWRQGLCAADVSGFYVDIELVFDHNNKAMRSGSVLGGALAVFRHIRLLGPNWADWATNPFATS